MPFILLLFLSTSTELLLEKEILLGSSNKFNSQTATISPTIIYFEIYFTFYLTHEIVKIKYTFGIQISYLFLDIVLDT